VSIHTVLLTMAFLSAAAYAPMARHRPSLLRTVLKTIPVALLALVGLLSGEPLLLVAALALSAVGDAALAQDGDTAFTAGLGAFLIAHVAYAALFFREGRGIGEAAPWVLALIVALAAIMGTVLVRRAGPLALPVAAYVAAIVVMGFGAATVGGYVLVGAALFMASDAILGFDRFVLAHDSPTRTPAGFLVWVLYVAGQAMILSGFIF
jgi:Predicted membrane protein